MHAASPGGPAALLVLVLALAATPAHAGEPDPGALRILRVAFIGLRTVAEEDLRALLPADLTEGRRPAVVRSRRVELARARVEEHLRDRGYLSARVTAREVRPGEEARFVVLELDVHEGYRYRVGALDVVGVGPEDRFEGLRRVVLRSGVLISAADLRRSREALGDLFGDRGHAFVTVTPRLVAHADAPVVDVSFRIHPGPLVTIAAVAVTGASRTGEQLVRRALLVRPGSAYHRTGLRHALERLRRSGAFRRVELTESAQGSRQVKLLVTVVELPILPAVPRSASTDPGLRGGSGR
jgi:outer membrane protein insertion porin family